MIAHYFTTAATTCLILAATLISLAPSSGAFSWTRSPVRHHNDRHPHRPPAAATTTTTRGKNFSPVTLFAVDSDTDTTESKNKEGVTVKALGPASVSSSSNNNVPSGEANADAVAPTQVFMITREMTRTMVEELGYKRAEVDSIRIELVANIIENRIRCPSTGMPTDWVDLEREAMNKSVRENANNSSSMMERLESESKYPLKFPLLAISLVLFGKGFSDALITLIKVNIAFPGASLTEQFQGIPILAIDFVCVVVGVGMGLWTWKTMK
mmetsp:Transcript_11927/g.25263  ORF Transcript_11927/g.25263 Transcript_11927/m.25263 type:complete len:269 (+) Transcript_11927:127-933(+)